MVGQTGSSNFLNIFLLFFNFCSQHNITQGNINATQRNVIQCNTTQRSATQYNAMQRNATQRMPMEHNVTQRNAM